MSGIDIVSEFINNVHHQKENTSAFLQACDIVSKAGGIVRLSVSSYHGYSIKWILVMDGDIYMISQSEENVYKAITSVSRIFYDKFSLKIETDNQYDPIKVVTRLLEKTKVS